VLLYFVISIRIARWVDEEEDKLKSSGETSLQYVILDMGGKQSTVQQFSFGKN
jgi:hypothetical protein